MYAALLIFSLQVARSTGILSHFVNLNIVIPEAFILGSGEHHVDVGSIINLVCIIEKVRRTRFNRVSFIDCRAINILILQRLEMINAALFNFSYERASVSSDRAPHFLSLLISLSRASLSNVAATRWKRGFHKINTCRPRRFYIGAAIDT